MHETSAIDIDLSAIDHNMKVVRRAVGEGCALCPIVKADAYGLGVSRVAKRLVSAGAEMLAVFSLRQAIETAAAVNGSTPILVLMPVTRIEREDELARLMLAGQLHLVVHDEANLQALEACAQSLGVALPVHVEVDVGMSRGGALPDEAIRIIRTIARSTRLQLRGVFAHFSHARTDAGLTARQLAAYDHVIAATRDVLPPDVYQHVASTYALARESNYHRTMVRFGLAWLGYGIDELEAREPLIHREDLKPVIRWSTSVVQAKSIPAGTAVGYGGRWVATRPSTIALIPVGYSDGYPTPRNPAASAASCVRLFSPDGRAVHAPVVGSVNMDQLTIDVTGLHVGDIHDWIGCRVELISRDIEAPTHLPRLAAEAGMIPHELLTRLNPRIARTTSITTSVLDADIVATTRGDSEGRRVNAAVG
ncbi:MAG: alanine racemase [Phycisphaerales bacterium]|jgi:alanine racemase